MKKNYLSSFNLSSSFSSGFTLVELLVVIAIIALISTVGFVNFQNLRMQARDQQRKADMTTITSAIAQFRAQYGYYPYFNEGGGVDTQVGGWARVHGLDQTRPTTCVFPTCPYPFKMFAGAPGNPNLAPTYLKKIPMDPTVGDEGPSVYCYWDDQGASLPPGPPKRYTLFMRLENSNDPDAMADKPMPPGPGSCIDPTGVPGEVCKVYRINTGNCARRASNPTVLTNSDYNYWKTNP